MPNFTRRSLLPLAAAAFLNSTSASAADRTLVVAVATVPASLETGVSSYRSLNIIMQTNESLVAEVVDEHTVHITTKTPFPTRNWFPGDRYELVVRS